MRSLGLCGQMQPSNPMPSTKALSGPPQFTNACLWHSFASLLHREQMRKLKAEVTKRSARRMLATTAPRLRGRWSALVRRIRRLQGRAFPKFLTICISEVDSSPKPEPSYSAQMADEKRAVKCPKRGSGCRKTSQLLAIARVFLVFFGLEHKSGCLLVA
jgi:hypothetical protein